MRSDVKHLAKCGQESAYYCRTKRWMCGNIHPNCFYKPKTCLKQEDKNEVHPIAIKLPELFMQAMASNLPATAWCIDLAMTAIGWELDSSANENSDLVVQNKIKEKIQRDKGVKFWL